MVGINNWLCYNDKDFPRLLLVRFSEALTYKLLEFKQRVELFTNKFFAFTVNLT